MRLRELLGDLLGGLAIFAAPYLGLWIAYGLGLI
jgi:hypothetical protein